MTDELYRQGVNLNSRLKTEDLCGEEQTVAINKTKQASGYGSTKHCLIQSSSTLSRALTAGELKTRTVAEV